MMALPRLIAHRGAAQFTPENTLIAMRRAHALGATWVEFDVTLTQDEQAVVFHDATLERTTNGKGLLREHSLAQLRALDAGSWFAAEFSGSRIPTLDEWLSSAARLGLGLNIELKPNGVNASRLVEKTMDGVIRHWSVRYPTLLFSSAEAECLAHLASYRQEFPFEVGLISDVWLPDWQSRLQELGCYSYHLNYHALTASRIDEVRRAGYVILAYTVNQTHQAQQLLQQGVSAVFSDNPLLLDRW